MFNKAIIYSALIMLSMEFTFADSVPTIITNSNFSQRPDTDILYNPGIGLSDFHHTVPYPYDKTARATIQTAYYRFYWNELENAAQGVFDFSPIDAALAITIARHQVLGIRIMSAKTLDWPGEDTIKIPAWLKSSIEVNGGSAGLIMGDHFFPNYNNPDIIAASRALLTALGKRYGNNHSLFFVDVGMVGLWGEWHDGTGDSMHLMPTPDNAKQYVDMHYSAFPNKPLVMLIGTGTASSNALLQYAATTFGMSWRADGWGDYRYLDTQHDNWTTVFPTVLNAVPEIERNWTKSPVLLETYNTIPETYGTCFTTQGSSPVKICNDAATMQEAFDFAVAHHVSSINTPGRDAGEIIPGAILAGYKAMLAKLGYRFVLSQTQTPATVEIGQPIIIASTWKNIGIAPVYATFKIGYRLRSIANGSVVAQQWLNNTSDIKTWLPIDSGGGIYTDVLTTTAFKPSESTPAGTYKVDLAMVSEPGDPIQLAITAAPQADGWYEVGETTLPIAIQTITATTAALTSASYNSTFPVAATASSDLPVTMTVAGGCLISGGTVTMTSSTNGCTVNYNQAGNANYSAAKQVSSTTEATKASQNIAVTTAAPVTAVKKSTFPVAATASSGLKVSITASPSTVCTFSSATGNVITKSVTSISTCTIHYAQWGNTNYFAAAQVTSKTTVK